MTDNEFSTYPLSVTIAAESLMDSSTSRYRGTDSIWSLMAIDHLMFSHSSTSATSTYADLGRGGGISYMHGRTTAHAAPEKGDENTIR
ncbi:hypothetical protein BPOR_0168g00100 [Botrytis porri]|uniref:Uncharacterized protein n=1 Tax=Botrytis porri TaxID=87229 RepID=A0A4Z1KUY8_9HELO|nr:hypothetical protein BPOR_0168g00100 [Botrytis porri]